MLEKSTVKEKRNAILAVFTILSMFLASLQYVFSCRKDIELIIGSWNLGFLEGMTLTTTIIITVYIMGPSLMQILNGLKEIGNRQKLQEEAEKLH